MDYVEKFEAMLKDGYGMQEVAENIYLNYQSVFNNDEVYKLRKEIAARYRCNINDVRLIGSSHTGYTFKTGKLEKRAEPNDYDFAIIDPAVFIRFFHEVDITKIRPEHLNSYKDRILVGKIHPIYANKEFRDSLESKNQGIMKKLKIKKHVSVCFYLSEKDFINGLVEYNEKLYQILLKKVASESGEHLSPTLGEIIDLSGFKPLDKMEE